MTNEFKRVSELVFWRVSCVFVLCFAQAVSAQSKYEYGKLVFSDDFEREESQEEVDEPGKNWTTSSEKTAKGKKQVDLKDGVLRFWTAPGANHDVSLRQEFEFQNGSVGMRFKLDKEKDELRLNFADLKLKSVHAGHLFDVTIGLKTVRIKDLKTGVMDKEIRKARLAKTFSGKELKKLAHDKTKTFRHKISKGKWHKLLVHVKGERVLVEIDGKSAGEFTAEGIAHPTKRLLRLLTPGSVTIDEVRFWRAQF